MQTGSLQQQFHHLLTTTFNQSELKLLLRHEFNVDLDVIVNTKAPFADIAYDVIDWAERLGYTADLVDSAYRVRETSEGWRILAAEIRQYQGRAAKDPRRRFDPESKFSEAYRLEWDGMYVRALTLYKEILNSPGMEFYPLIKLAAAERIDILEQRLLDREHPHASARPAAPKSNSSPFLWAIILAIGILVTSVLVVSNEPRFGRLFMATPAPIPTLPPWLAQITANDLVNIRSGPGTNYTIVGNAEIGETFPVLGKDPAGDWWQIQFNGREAWVLGDFVTASNVADVPVAPNIPPSPTPRPLPADVATPVPSDSLP